MRKLLDKCYYAIIILAIVFVSACSSQPASDTKSGAGAAENLNKAKEIRIGYQVIPNAELLAKSLGLYQKKFEAEGIKVHLRQFDSARDVNTAMTAGGIDIGLIGSSSVATGVAQKLPYQVIWIHDVIGDNEALVVKKGSGIKSIKDVKGKKIAVPFGSTTHYSFLSALRANKIDQKEVNILDMQPQDMLAAYKQGQIDGGYVWYPILGKMMEDGEIVVTSRDLAQDGILTADLCVANTSFIKDNPDLVQKYIEVLDEAVKFYRSSKAEAVKAMGKELNLPESEAELYMSQLIWLDASEQAGYQYLGTQDNKGRFASALKDTGEFMVTQKTISSAPDLDAYKEAIQAQFVSKVAEAFKK